MTPQTVHFPTVLMAFFAIMNPLANTPIFLGLTDGLDPETRRAVASRGVLTAFAIVAAFAIFGRAIFSIFDITLPAFRIAGGLLVGLVGFHLLQGSESRVHTPSADDLSRSRDAALGIAVTPLAMPILAGPGTIATAMSFAADATAGGVIMVLIALALICAATWLAFVSGQVLMRLLGQSAINVVTRLMGLILAVIGVQIVLLGIRGARLLP